MKKALIMFFAILMAMPCLMAQGITTHAYRRVEPQDMNEYLKRETTYWKKFAEQEVTKGNLTFWAILVRVGDVGEDHRPNVLIINTLNDIDKGLDWESVSDLFPDIKMEDINTNNLSKQTATIYLHSQENHINAPEANPQEDYKYVKIVYHNPKNTGVLLDFERDKWKPMLEKAMADGKTTLKGWGNARVLHPSSSKFPYTTQSYDLFSSLNDALLPYFSDDVDMADDFFADIADNDESRRSIGLYYIVSFVSAPPAE